MDQSFRRELMEEMQSLRTVDCHSHTALRRVYYESGEKNLFNLMSYFEREIYSVAGKGSGQLHEGAASDEERWQRLKPVLSRSQPALRDDGSPRRSCQPLGPPPGQAGRAPSFAPAGA